MESATHTTSKMQACFLECSLLLQCLRRNRLRTPPPTFGSKKVPLMVYVFAHGWPTPPVGCRPTAVMRHTLPRMVL